jgi:manganese/zinc/iron transport system substrate-binding protein
MRFISLCTGFVLAALAGCSDPHDHAKKTLHINKRHAGDSPLRIACTTGMVADLVANVGGEHVKVSQLFGPGVDPHTYAPSPRDVSLLQSADMVIYNGLHLEGKMTELFESLAQRVPSIGIGDHLSADKILRDEDGAVDPHIWFDVSLWAEATGIVAEALSQYDPNRAAEYKARAQSYRKKLDELHAWTRERIMEIPRNQRVLITSHDAFRYFHKAYGMEVRGIQGITTDTEASIAKINDLVRYIHANKLKAVFVETSVNERTMKTLRDGCARLGHEVAVGGTLFSDAMGDANSVEGTYEGMIRHNVESMVRALK